MFFMNQRLKFFAQNFIFRDLIRTNKPTIKLIIPMMRQTFIIPNKGINRMVVSKAPTAPPKKSDPRIPVAVLEILA